MMGKKKALFRLFALLLCCSYLVSLNAAPLSRKSISGYNQQGASAQEAMTTDQMATEEEAFGEGRMSLEVDDYPGSGANNRHDPKSPGKA
ncbi:uncharacterized protein A4U43_C07F8260 [Asparagus officinalis]|uniref:Uncharacterized protein n=1 Tax=Asparagus officinalis TaxID=4686 RepID=A0A5P1EDD0_ASPOF|nr:uncharacterized protein LOC109850907 isoform X2 [Asparagus officinalis]ONK62799.1 uncharacterized protein A4U43_C07F8260 [Asparagus officinalis]